VVIAAVDGRDFEYDRVSYDHRPIVFQGEETFVSGGWSLSNAGSWLACGITAKPRRAVPTSGRWVAV
jgi:hypothetical protein